MLNRKGIRVFKVNAVKQMVTERLILFSHGNRASPFIKSFGAQFQATLFSSAIF